MPKIAILENTKIVWNALINDFAKTNKMGERKMPKSKVAGKQNGGKPLKHVGNCPTGALKAKGLTNKSTKYLV